MNRISIFILAVSVLSIAPVLSAQPLDGARGPERSVLVQGVEGQKSPDQAKIDAAIKKGCDFLLTTDPTKGRTGDPEYFIPAELALLTLIHGGAFTESNEKCKKLLDYVVNTRPVYTYRAAVKAMALAALDREKYVEYIAQCGQYLVDTQLHEGDWGYGDPKGKHQSDAMTPKLRDSSGSGKVTGTVMKLKPAEKRQPHNGDNSNAQFASLGLRACEDSGIEVPRKTLKLARDWWTKTQYTDGGWTYMGRGAGLQEPDSDRKPKEEGTPSATMTAGGVSSLAIYGFLLGDLKTKDDIANDPVIAAGIRWMGHELGKTGREKSFADWTGPYLAYSIERAGVLASFDTLGRNDWYRENVRWILSRQQSDGSWKQSSSSFIIHDTCFAILCLKKSTVSLIDTGKKPDPPPEKIEDKPIDSSKPDKK